MGYQPFSDDLAEKVCAALAASRRARSQHSEAYARACRKWYEKLPQTDRTIVDVTADAFVSGEEERAYLLANLLPRAPQPTNRVRIALFRAGRKDH